MSWTATCRDLFCNLAGTVCAPLSPLFLLCSSAHFRVLCTSWVSIAAILGDINRGGQLFSALGTPSTRVHGAAWTA